MKFYTNITEVRGKILAIGYENGKRFKEKIKYKPYVFIPSRDGNSRYRTIDNKIVDKFEFDSIPEAREFITQYKDVDNFSMYGLTNWPYLYIFDNFKGDIDYDPRHIRVINIDIEVASDEGFPDIGLAEKPVTAITIKKGNEFIAFGCGSYTPSRPNVTYVKCDNEVDLLTKFLALWNSDNWQPDVVTGWNCIPVEQGVWTKDAIVPIAHIQSERLYNSHVKARSPISRKRMYSVVTSAGHVVNSSPDHKFRVVVCGREKDTNLSESHKTKTEIVDMTVSNIAERLATDAIFVKIPIRDNQNNDQNISDRDLYLAGLVYTDGTLDEYRYRIYQSDLDMMNKIRDRFNIDVVIHGPYKNCYQMDLKRSAYSFHDYIYRGTEKKLNLNLISKLSRRQFLIFLSGLLDGDGFVTHGKVGFCNFNNDLNTLQELLAWNGIFATVYDTRLRMMDNIKDSLSLMKESRWGDFIEGEPLARKSSQKASLIKFKRFDDHVLVPIHHVIESDEYVDMMDIETDTHLFVTNGVEVHNCELFDIPYLVNRIMRILPEGEEKKLSPWGILREYSVSWHGKENQAYTPVGVTVLDYLQLYKKFTYTKQEFYSLDFIANVELGERKTDYSEYGTLLNLYKENFQKFMDYNIRDVELVDRIDEKMKLLELVYAMAFDAKVNFADTLKSVRPWDIIIHNFLLGRCRVVPFFELEEDEDFDGAYVKEPIPGRYLWVVSFDLNSLYPHLIQMYNIGPDTFIEQFKENVSIDEILSGGLAKYRDHVTSRNMTVSANLSCYTRDKQGFLAELMEKMYNDRVVYKKKMLEAKKAYETEKTYDNEKLISRYDNMQMAKKIQLNSCYGALGNRYFRWYQKVFAESITLSGQLAIRWVEQEINAYMNRLLKTKGVDYVIASDTDSLYLNFSTIVEKFCVGKSKEKTTAFVDKICEEVFQPEIDRIYQRLADYVNAYAQKMIMKRESIADVGIWVAKKRYILNVLNSEGVQYAEPKLKIMGLEVVRSSTPQVVRKKLKEAISIIVNKDRETLLSFIDEFRKEFMTLPFEDIAFPRGLTDMNKWISPDRLYDSGTPIHVKASVVYNNLIKQKSLDNKYPFIYNGDRIRFAYLIYPNSILENSIATPTILPPEFGLHDFIDYETQFDKAFIKPVTNILSAIDWTLSDTYSLDMFAD